MIDQYEKLKKKGYEEEEITLDGPVSEMDVFTSPLGDGRDDRGVVVTDPNGLTKKTSSIMMGYNRKGISLPNGDYVSWDDVESALDVTMAEAQEDERDVVFVCKRTGDVVDPEQIVSQIHEIVTEKPYLYRSPSKVMKNQTSDHVSIFDDDKEYPKGVSMLGNEGIQLTSGEYVSKDELERALEDYVIMKGPEPIYTVIQRQYRKMAWIPALVTAVTLFVSGFGIGDVVEKKVTEQSSMTATYDTAIVQEVVDETPTIFDFEDENGIITIGSGILVPEGVPYYESSDYQYGGADKSGIIGNGIRNEGLYTVDRFAILYDGKIVEHEWDDGIELSKLLEVKAQELGVSVDDLIPMLHIGGPVTGWVNIDDVIAASNKDGHLDQVNVILDDDARYRGIIEDFSGEDIVINVDGEDVSLKVVNADGNYVQPGDIVVGSDGKQYQMNGFSVEQDVKLVEEEEVVGQKVNWSIKNISAEEALLIGGLAAATAYLSLRKRKEMVEMTDSQLDALVNSAQNEFEGAKAEFDGVSTFEDAARKLTGRESSTEISAADLLKDELIKKNITVEDVHNMGKDNTGAGGKKN